VDSNTSELVGHLFAASITSQLGYFVPIIETLKDIKVTNKLLSAADEPPKSPIGVDPSLSRHSQPTIREIPSANRMTSEVPLTLHSQTMPTTTQYPGLEPAVRGDNNQALGIKQHVLALGKYLSIISPEGALADGLRRWWRNSRLFESPNPASIDGENCIPRE
jgi:hypothetical protein